MMPHADLTSKGWCVHLHVFQVTSAHLVSSHSGEGIAAVTSKVCRERKGRDVFVVGAANVGKSAFVRAMLKEMSRCALVGCGCCSCGGSGWLVLLLLWWYLWWMLRFGGCCGCQSLHCSLTAGPMMLLSRVCGGRRQHGQERVRARHAERYEQVRAGWLLLLL
jgi:hypothetical protein